MRHFIAEDFAHIKRKRKTIKSFLEKKYHWLVGSHHKNISKEKSGKPKYGIFSIFGIIIVIALISFGASVWKKTTSEKPPSPSNKIIAPDIKKAANNELPKNFPDFIPIEGKNEIDRAYDASYPNSSLKQGTTILNSQKSQKENYDFYRQWAMDNQWEIINYLDSGPVWSLYLRKANEDINLTFSAGAINISYSKLNP